MIEISNSVYLFLMASWILPKISPTTITAGFSLSEIGLCFYYNVILCYKNLSNIFKKSGNMVYNFEYFLFLFTKRCLYQFFNSVKDDQFQSHIMCVTGLFFFYFMHSLRTKTAKSLIMAKSFHLKIVYHILYFIFQYRSTEIYFQTCF